MPHSLKKILPAIFLLNAIIFWPSIIEAQSVFLTSPKSSYSAGTYFTATLYVNTGGNSINTVEGKVKIPTTLEIIDVRYGQSIISLWVLKPVVDKSTGTISFSGGIPGGYNGSSGAIFTINLRGSAGGQEVSIKPSDFKVLLNDGQGTELSNVSLKSLSISIQEKKEAPVTETPKKEEIKSEVAQESAEPPVDEIPPESFIPLVARYEGFADNSYFVSFFAVDKDSGISHYEIFEKPYLFFRKEIWKQAETPYILGNQWRASKVYIKAYDQSGNYRIEYARKPFHPLIQWIFGILAVLSALTAGFYLGVHSRRKKHVKIRI